MKLRSCSVSSAGPNIAWRVLGLSVCATCWGWTPAVQAGISQLDIYRINAYQQTGNGNTISYSNSYLALGLTSVNANDYNSVQATYPGSSSPLTLNQTAATTFNYQSGAFSSQSAMDAAYPAGTYSFQASNGGAPDTASFIYSSDYYPLSQPYLTGTTYSALQGMNSQTAFTFQFSSFVPGSLPSGSVANIYFYIYNLTTNSFAVNDGPLASTTTSLTIAANTLTPGDQYAIDFIFENSIFVTSPGAQLSAQLSFDLYDELQFTTASVPEPAAIVIFAPACAFLVVVGRKLRRRTETTTQLVFHPNIELGPSRRTCFNARSQIRRHMVEHLMRWILGVIRPRDHEAHRAS